MGGWDDGAEVAFGGSAIRDCPGYVGIMSVTDAGSKPAMESCYACSSGGRPAASTLATV